MYSYLMSKMKYNFFFRVKDCFRKFLTFAILVAIFWHGFFLRSYPSNVNYLEPNFPVKSIKRWMFPYPAVNPILDDHQLSTQATRFKSSVPIEIRYMAFPITPSEVLLGSKDVAREDAAKELSVYGDFYSFIKRPQFHCSKLVRMGGAMDCEGNAKQSQMDGHKLVCMDPQMELNVQRNPEECLTLSFGISVEVSFDEAVAAFNCEIHMFDLYNTKINDALQRENPHAHFHTSALGSEDRILHYPEYNNKTVGQFTLQTTLSENGLLTRPIHILKMDIEMSEWMVLKENLLKANILDTVGQIAMEIHTTDIVQNLKNATTSEKMEALQEKYNILRDLESHGFLPVSYWDNVQDDTALYDNAGRRYETAGEILYVNTNWYNKSFKQTLVQNGIKLRYS